MFGIHIWGVDFCAKSVSEFLDLSLGVDVCEIYASDLGIPIWGRISVGSGFFYFLVLRPWG